MDSIKNNIYRSASKITEEVFNSVTHGLGLIGAIVGLLFGLLTLNAPLHFRVGFIIYAVSLVLLMTMSTLYHALYFSRAKRVFQILDHSSILLLIAGSYTPFIIYLFSGWGLGVILALVWSIAVFGIVMNAALPKLTKKLGVGLYLGFGWFALLLAPRISQLESNVMALIVAGGVLYTTGALMLIYKKPFVHVGWHIMVVLAAIAHYMAILQLY